MKMKLKYNIFLSALTSVFFVFLIFTFLNNGVSADCCCGGGAWCADCTAFCGGDGDDGGGCTPVACHDCTPAIPAGYTATNNGCSITTTTKCTGTTHCKSCTITKTRWFIETNLTPEPQSTSLNMIIDGEDYSLSLNSATPATVKYPSIQNNVQTSLPTRSVPSTASGLGYVFRANNYGLDSEWISFGCTNAEDYCIESTSNIQNFVPSSLTISEVLKENAQGQISGMYYTVNMCNTDKLYSLPLEAYYKVDNLPEPRDVCDWNPSILASDPECDITRPPEEPQDPVCPMNLGDPCTKEEFLPDVGGTDSTSSKGCYSEDYTGREVNNPLKVRVVGSDSDGVGEIKGAIVWLNRILDGGETPVLVDRVDTGYSSTNPNNIGILILQNDNSWENDPLIYGITKEGQWARLDNGTLLIEGDSSSIKVLISKDNIEVGTEVVTFEMSLDFKYSSDTTLSGMYNFKSIVLDQYMILSDGKIDQGEMETYFTWGIDLQDPTMEISSPAVLGAQRMNLNLESYGTGSNITDILINAYRDGELASAPISLENPLGYEDISPVADIPPVDLIGHLSGLSYSDNSWRFSGIDTEEYSSNGEILVNIGLNEGGTIIIYTTAYDQACNTTSVDEPIDLRPWIATRGGVIYSEDRMASDAKNLSPEENADSYTKNGESTLVNFTLQQIFEELTTGTELISSRQEAINNILYSEDIDVVRANFVYDSNDKKNYWFEYFKRKLIEKTQDIGYLSSFAIGGEDKKVTDSCMEENCYMYLEENDGNIEIPPGYKCDRKTLFISEGNIIINPDIVSDGDGVEGCIFLAKDKIIINGGGFKSDSGIVEYDYIEGFLIAEDQILINIADEDKVVRDGLEIEGGLVAFGRDSLDSPALVINRSLRLFNYSNPTLAMIWNVKYAKLSETFFGKEASIYKQEVGFKAF